jgi:hypothetical protein
MSTPSPYRALFSPVGMTGTVCHQIAAGSLPDPIRAQAAKVGKLADEAADVISKSLTDATIRKMWAHGQQFVSACHRHGLISKNATSETPAVILARLMAGHLAIDHHCRRAKLHRYPLWRELERSAATLLDMLLSMDRANESECYAVADEMCAVVAPPMKRERRKAA